MSHEPVAPIEPIDVSPGADPVQGGGGETIDPAAITDLSQRIQFRAYPFEREDVTRTGWVSVEPTLGLNERMSNDALGFFKHIRAQLVYNRGRGTMQLAILTDNKQSIGGFLNGGGHTRAMLPVVVRGTVTLWSTGTECPLG